jgi:hypothetical protein
MLYAQLYDYAENRGYVESKKKNVPAKTKETKSGNKKQAK